MIHPVVPHKGWMTKSKICNRSETIMINIFWFDAQQLAEQITIYYIKNQYIYIYIIILLTHLNRE